MVVAIAAGVSVESLGGPPLPEAVGDLAAGLALLGGGIIVSAWRGRDGCAALLALAGVAWFAGVASDALLFAHRGPLAHLLLAYPTGRVRSRAVWAVVGISYVAGLVPQIARASGATVALMTALAMAASWQHRAARGIERRARAVARAGALVVGAALVVAAVARAYEANVDTAALWAYYVAVTFTAVALAVGLVLGPWTRAAVTGLVIDLGDRHEPQALRSALAHTLGDPALQVAFLVAGREQWVDESGRPVELPVADAAGRGVSMVHNDAGDAVVALVHDHAALADPELVVSVAAAVRLAVANVEMQAEVVRRVREVDASRQRLVEAGDDERRRLREELRASVELPLEAISGQLAALAADRDGEAADALRVLRTELDDACVDLSRFAQGVHPRVLTERGLGPALAELTAQSAVPVTVTVTSRRLPSAHEAAAYFVCSEGLANVAKHASTARVDIAVTATDDRLVVHVADDGDGGADPARGSGLRGLGDRVNALGGTLRVQSPPGSGTRLEAELPIPRAELSASETIAP